MPLHPLIPSTSNCLGTDNSVVVDFLLVRFFASCTLGTSFVFLLLILLWFGNWLDVLLDLTRVFGDFGLFNLLRRWSESLEVVSNDLLFAWKEGGLHLQGLCVRLLVLLGCLIAWLLT